MILAESLGDALQSRRPTCDPDVGLHHQRLNGNYGLFFRFWDRAFGTELTGYEEAFVDRGWPDHLPAPESPSRSQVL